MTNAAIRCRKKFLRFFPEGFRDTRYLDWERSYKEAAHHSWMKQLGPGSFHELLKAHRYQEIAAQAVRIESRTNLLFSFEKIALRDATRSRPGAKRLAEGLHDFLYGRGSEEARFERWCLALESLPRRQTRVLSWPAATVFGFIAQPKRHFFLKPNVTRLAAVAYGFDLPYRSHPGWETYHALLRFAGIVQSDLRDLRPRDMIDIQSFLWVQGSEEYRGSTFRPAQTTATAMRRLELG